MPAGSWPKNANQKEADRWLRQAQHDLRAAEINRQAEFPEIACFLAHQTAEEALKAHLPAQGRRAVIGTATRRPVGECAHHDRAFDALGDACRYLDQYYVPTRYASGLPGGIPHEALTDAQAREALNHAGLVDDKALRSLWLAPFEVGGG